MKSCIIIANGDLPKRGVLRHLTNNGVATIIAADGGANLAYKLGLVPRYIVGDFDSITSETKKFYSNKSELIHYKRQNDTDVEKALKLAIRKRYKIAYLLGGTGDRLDHTLCNIGIVLKFYNKIKTIIIHGNTILSPYEADTKLKTIPNETISIYAFDDDTFVTSKGLRYPLKNANLKFGKAESTSNVALGSEVNLKISGGIIFIIRELKTVMQNGILFKS